MLRLHDVESLRCDHEESLDAIKAREKAFSERFQELFRRYCEQLRTSSSTWAFVAGDRAQRKQIISKNAEMLERLRMYEDEEARGDIGRLVQLFPMLLEDFVASSSSSSADMLEYDKAIRPEVRTILEPYSFHSLS